MNPPCGNEVPADSIPAPPTLLAQADEDRIANSFDAVHELVGRMEPKASSADVRQVGAIRFAIAPYALSRLTEPQQTPTSS